MKRVLVFLASFFITSAVFADVTGPVTPPGGSGVGSLPSQTGNSGKFLTTDGSAASWASPTASASSVTPGTTTIVGATAPCLLENPSTTLMACLGLGTSVATALGVNVGSAGSIVVNGGALGTPSSGNGSNITNVNAASVGGFTLPCTVPTLVSGDYLTNNGTTCSWATPTAGGTVTSFSFTNGGGINGSVATATTTPALSLTPSFSGIAEATSGTGFAAATASNILSVVNEQTCNAQTGTTYTYVIGDANNCVTGSNAAAQTYTVPPNSSVAFPVGTTLTTVQLGAGTITIGPGTGVTLQSAKYGSSTSQTYAFAAQYSCISLQKTATDTWFVSSCDFNPIPAVGANGTVLAVSGGVPAWVSGVLSVSGTPATYQTAAFTSNTGVEGIGPGTSGQCYLSNGASAYPSFQTCPSGGLSGMTAGQVPIAATATTVTSSKPLAGAGAGIATGPTSAVAGDVTTYQGIAGQIQDSGVALSSLASISTTVTYTANQTAGTSDNGKLVVMNCASACAYTLPATQPSTSWSAHVMSIGSTTATIALGGTDTFNGTTSVPVLNKFRPLLVYANSGTSTDYEGDAPLAAGTGITLAPASNGFSLAVASALPSTTSVNGSTIPSSATITQTIASGATAMPTSAVSANSCSASATTATATGAATTDSIIVTYASDPTGVTGYGAGTNGGITIRSWATTNTVNFKLCNESGTSITPGSLSVNWRIVR